MDESGTTACSTFARHSLADGCGRCWYCAAPLSKRHEHDHFPTPRSAAGASVVPACLNCHDMKDRIPLLDWPIGALEDLCADDIGRRIMVVLGATDAADDPRSWLDAGAELDGLLGDRDTWWPTVNAMTRLLYAKVRRNVACRDELAVAR